MAKQLTGTDIILRDEWKRMSEFERDYQRTEYRWLRQDGLTRIQAKGTIARSCILANHVRDIVAIDAVTGRPVAEVRADRERELIAEYGEDNYYG